MLLLVVGGVKTANAFGEAYIHCTTSNWGNDGGTNMMFVKDGDYFYYDLDGSEVNSGVFYFRIRVKWNNPTENSDGEYLVPSQDHDEITSSPYYVERRWQDHNNLTFTLAKNANAKKVRLQLWWDSKDQKWYLVAYTLNQQNTVYFNNNAGWTNAYCYVFDYDSNGYPYKPLGNWPGTELTDGSVSFYGTSTTKVIFTNNNNDDSKQTGDLDVVNSGVYEFTENKGTDCLKAIRAFISAANYATFSTTQPLTIPSDGTITAYRADNVNASGEIIFKKVSGDISANTGLLLKSSGAATQDFAIASEGNSVGTNLMVATTSETEVAASTEGTYNYFLANGDNGVGFYNLESATTSSAGKAYLSTTTSLTTTSSARVSWTFEDNEATGINIIKSEIQDKGIYNLNGQRVNNAVRGMYIVNGKKVIMK